MSLLQICTVQNNRQIQPYIDKNKSVAELACIQHRDKQVVRVLTRCGYTIEIPTDGSLLVASEKEMPHFKKVTEISPGNFACIERFNIDGKIVELPEIDYQKMSRYYKHILELPNTLTEDLAWALGVMIGDGSYRDRRDGTIEITNQDLELIRKYVSIFEGFGLKVSVKSKRNHYRIYFICKPFRNWLENLGLDYALAFNKKTPHVIFSATAKVRAAYLRGLFDTDGSVGKTNTRFTSSSRKLVEEVHSLLLSLGIVSVLSSQGERHHKVAVSGPSVIPFSKRVNFVIERKSRLLSILVKRAIEKGKANIDVIPFGTQLINEFKATIKNTRGVKGKGLSANASYQYNFVHLAARRKIQCTYFHLQKLVDFSVHHQTYLPESIQKTIDANYFFDKIVSVEYLGQ
ncbi:LAGLIDADG family homing endonuclease [Anabaena azotica]|uniref:DOD-type homing endonuclease domain-containing protein n=1 Tax=Anabaena azotica FACHB-119 TaxID=947527 RepID=A0ABR8DG04_9NOST|nr:LAGLIDADG family homing endonuclease [Anabaena azotica]MBD2505340.1 hypothetical protein [Anabaena azotica FACHB-119]